MGNSFMERHFCQFRILTDNGPICWEGKPGYYDLCPHTLEDIRPVRIHGLRVIGCPKFQATSGLREYLEWQEKS